MICLLGEGPANDPIAKAMRDDADRTINVGITRNSISHAGNAGLKLPECETVSPIRHLVTVPLQGCSQRPQHETRLKQSRNQDDFLKDFLASRQQDVPHRGDRLPSLRQQQRE
jgi:hypothetical protein